MILWWLASLACQVPECAHGDLRHATCRVAAENHYARLITSLGVELRFHDPAAPAAPGWEALGLLQERPGEGVAARPSGLGGFALSLDASRSGTDIALPLRLTNVAPDTVVSVGPLDALVALPSPASPVGLVRDLMVDVPAGERIFVTGERRCPDAYRLAAAGDVQTNPVQFERIVQALHDEVARGDVDAEPLLGFLLLGDLAEHATDDELRRVSEILASSPVPVATTPGNHDVYGEEMALYNRSFGPGTHAFDVCRTRVVLLDTGNGALAPSVEGRLPELLERTGRDFLIAGSHYPIHTGRAGGGWSDEAQAWGLAADLVRHDADLYLAGHKHTWRAFDDIPVGRGTLDEVITGTAGGSQGLGQPHYGFTRLAFGAGLDVCFVEVPEPGRPPGEAGAGQAPIRYCAR